MRIDLGCRGIGCQGLKREEVTKGRETGIIGSFII
jgi:hypothetical protein